MALVLDFIRGPQQVGANKHGIVQVLTDAAGSAWATHVGATLIPSGDTALTGSVIPTTAHIVTLSRHGNLVALQYQGQHVTQQGGAATFVRLLGIPRGWRPRDTMCTTTPVNDNGALNAGTVFVGSDGEIFITATAAGGNWTGGAVLGAIAPFCVVYEAEPFFN